LSLSLFTSSTPTYETREREREKDKRRRSDRHRQKSSLSGRKGYLLLVSQVNQKRSRSRVGMKSQELCFGNFWLKKKKEQQDLLLKRKEGGVSFCSRE